MARSSPSLPPEGERYPPSVPPIDVNHVNLLVSFLDQQGTIDIRTSTRWATLLAERGPFCGFRRSEGMPALLTAPRIARWFHPIVIRHRPTLLLITSLVLTEKKSQEATS